LRFTPLLTPKRHPNPSEALIFRLRPTRETLESLRATFQKLEQEETDDSAQTAEPVGELKRALLNCIADLELSQILDASVGAAYDARNPADLPPLASTIEEENLDAFTENTKLDKLD
jgi:hypothetical protein